MNEGMDIITANIIDGYIVIMNCGDNRYDKAFPKAEELSTYAAMVYSGKVDHKMNSLVRVGSTTMTVYDMINIALSTFIVHYEDRYTGDSSFDFIKQSAIDYFGDSLYYLNLELGTEYE